MHGLPGPALAAATLLALTVAVSAVSAAFAENDASKAESPPANSTTPPAPPAPPAPQATPEITVLNKHEVEGVLGRDVRSAAAEDMGRIVDVLVNRAGQVRAAIIDFGGFLGVGSRKVAVDWRALRFEPTGKPDHITLDLTRNSVRLAPEYKEGSPVVVLGTPEASQPTNGSASKDAPK